MKSYSKGRSTYKFGATTCNFKACGDKNGIQKQSQCPLSNVGRVTIHKTIWQVESDIKIPKDLREDTSEDKQVTLPLRSKIFQNIVKSHLGTQEKKKKKYIFSITFNFSFQMESIQTCIFYFYGSVELEDYLLLKHCTGQYDME